MSETFSDNDLLWSQLIQLGDMLGDGDCDAWVGKEYKRVAKALGLVKSKPRKNHSKQIDEFMEKRITQIKCSKCNGELKQSRKGSFRAVCINCGTKFILGKKRRK